MADDRAIVVDAERLPWQVAPTPGVSYKSLRFDSESKAGAVLIHMTPGSAYPLHQATAGEELFVVDGELICGQVHVGRGGYHYSPPGTEHAPRTEIGAVIFATFPGRVMHRSKTPAQPTPA